MSAALTLLKGVIQVSQNLSKAVHKWNILILSYRNTALIFTIFKADNVLQPIWHLTQGELAMTSETQVDKDQVIADINAIPLYIHNLLFIIWSSVSYEGTSLF